MAAQVVSAEKRYRISLLLDAYRDLLTEKQAQFLRRYYEEDYSFGEIAREFDVTRQAIFDSVKHGEAALENYERALGLVAARLREADPATDDASPHSPDFTFARAPDWADRLRRMAESVGAIGDAGSRERLRAELTALAREIEAASSAPAGAGARANGSHQAVGAPAATPLVADGPEFD